MTTGDASAYEIIAVTNVEMAPHFMVDGDPRTFGDSRNFVITQSLNKFFSYDKTDASGNVSRVAKIYMSFRRSVRSDEMHPLDFGRLLLSPSITYDIAINRNNRTTQEIHTIPRANAYVTLPILMRIDVIGLENLYVDE